MDGGRVNVDKNNRYRIFVGAFPTGQLAADLQHLRQRYDPKTAAITPPHVTLAGTYWRPGPYRAEGEAPSIDKLAETCSKLQPFELVLGGVRTFTPTQRPVIYLAVEQTKSLLAIRQALLAVLGVDHHRRYTPHLTLAMRLRSEQARAMQAELSGGSWDIGVFKLPIQQLHLMQRGPRDPAWQILAVFDLNSNSSRAVAGIN